MFPGWFEKRARDRSILVTFCIHILTCSVMQAISETFIKLSRGQRTSNTKLRTNSFTNSWRDAHQTWTPYLGFCSHRTRGKGRRIMIFIKIKFDARYRSKNLIQNFAENVVGKGGKWQYRERDEWWQLGATRVWRSLSNDAALTE